MRELPSFYRGLAAGFLLGTAARALLSTLFYLSLVTFRINLTAAWILVFLAPAVVILAPRSRAPLVVAALATAMLPFARFTDAYVPVAALASAASLFAIAQGDRASGAGTLVGLALNGAFLVAGASQDPALSFPGVVVVLAIGAVGVLSRGPEQDERPSLIGATAWACLLALELAFLASPFALAERVGAPAWAVAVLSLAGLATGASFPQHARVLAGVALLAFVDLAYARTPFSPVSALLAQVALGACAARLARPHPGVLAGVLTPLVFGILYFSQTLGPLEWGLLVPALALAPLAGAIPRAGVPPAARRPVAPFALAIALVAPGALPVADIDPPDPSSPLRVVNWNVHQGFGNRGALDPAIYLQALAALEPDVLVLQESDTQRISSGGVDIVHYLARGLDMRIHTSGHGVNILSRFPLDPHAPPPRTSTWSAEVALDLHGQTVWVHGVHLARSPQERTRQVAAVLDATNATGEPRVLAGDLNSCLGATCFGQRPPDGVHERLGSAFQDAWLATHDGDADDPSGFTHPASAPRRRIDVVMTRGLDAIWAGPLLDETVRLASDHLPVLVLLHVPNPPGRGP